ncbi:MAG: tRNA pseudouridine(55) synthase TruB [Gemmatimonadales bacterium]|nr:tRNA pseudouridine(55) synthase TruB [Gemmatimonadales bacterium]NIN50188.1 tRNA pseudouridine(55) synthase TruB [Gemmatimonadales bacterium]NIP07652.1 tRNA pseudouridine(55) synthase TruB [Gemmatimonadales bacterium]NIR01804.1 tRNA pseudouridine(55) synthase TruB [Gemmatimonadales bacterium]NIS65707.1 tRNA pseudouridine(55) synthase TruB [Gemmatimonadales bacterium]
MRRALGTRRVGHTGTLDPFASGLLIVLVGRATRLARFLVGLPKCYTGTIQLGVETDTDDRTGTVTANSDDWRSVSDTAISDAMTALKGRVQQQPPPFSAKKLAGERAHRLARRGKPVDLQPREVEVGEFALMGREGPLMHFAAQVSSGTYLRALARDLGAALRCGAHLHQLRRTAVGPFRVEDAVAPEAVDRQRTPIHAPREAVQHLPTFELNDELRGKVVHGQPVPAADAVDDPVALVAHGRLVAVAERQGDLFKPRVVLEA